jgi:FkbM family methyltransferase
MLNLFGFDVFKIDSAELFNFSNILFLLLNEEGHIRYLQIGANDGVLADPMYGFVCKHQNQVTGLLIEPIEFYFQKLQRNYSKFPGITALRIAIHNFEISMTMYVPRKSSSRRHNKDVAGLSSFNKLHLLKHENLVETDIVEEQVKCCSVEELLEEHSFMDINLLIVDTEGYDFQILDKLNLNQIQPKVIRFEHGMAAGTMTANQLNSLCEKFNKFGYQMIIDNNDAIAVQTVFVMNSVD